MLQPLFEPGIRPIAGEELGFYREHGWARLEGLVSQAIAAALLAKAEDLISRAAAARESGADSGDDFWFSWSNSVFEARYMADGPFNDLARSRAMGRQASRLIQAARGQGEECGVRSLGGNLFCKLGGESQWGREIPFHQDGPSFDVTERGFVTIWISLEEVAPEQGTMCFLDGSHRVGGLDTHRAGFPLDRRPELFELYDLTEPRHFAAGDASAHDGFMLHGSPANLTNRPRWGYACLYLAADLAFDDSAYTDRPHGFRGAEERYPVVYAGAG